MTDPRTATRRLRSQMLSGQQKRTPIEVVRWLGAVQSQDFAGAMWAIAQRASVDVPAVEQEVIDGSVLRLHVLRPTWHFVPAEDARWMLELTASRIIRSSAARYRELGIDLGMIKRSQETFRRLLSGGNQQTRIELETAVRLSGIDTSVPQRLVHLLMRAELDGVLCSGGWKGKEVTYALLDERVPDHAALSREQALKELTLRYFRSHGPASIKDFAWWSGLTIGDARAGIEMAQENLLRDEVDGLTCWSSPGQTPAGLDTPAVHLLPNYDEYVVSYSDRSAIFDDSNAGRLHMHGGILNNVILVDGIVSGGWSRKVRKANVLIEARPLGQFNNQQKKALEQAALRYGEAHRTNAILAIKEET